MTWKVVIEKRALKEIGRLGKPDQIRIMRFLKENLSTTDDPRSNGSPLSGSLSHLWRYRVGNYRIISKIEDDELSVLVVRVGHRKEVYR